MSETDQDRTSWNDALARDPILAPFAVDGALVLWPGEATAPVFANPAGRALLRLDQGAPPLPNATTARLRLLAGGLASTQALRLERLRLLPGLSGLVTCGVKMLADTNLLALAVSGKELARLGIAIRLAAAPAPTDAPGATAPAAPLPASVAPSVSRRPNLRFLWQSDATGRIASVSPDFAELAGQQAAAGMIGRAWDELLAGDVVDLDGDLAETLASQTTWSGKPVLWRVAEPGKAARVELSGFPVFEAGRKPAGLRGFGLARSSENEDMPAPETGPLTAPLATPDRPAPAVDDTEGAIEQSVELLEPAHTVPAAVTSELAVGVESADVSVEAATPEPEPEATIAPMADDEHAEAAAGEPELPLGPAADTTADAVKETAPKDTPVSGETADNSPGANVVRLRNGDMTAIRPVLEPSRPALNRAERNAFREIAKALGARMPDENEDGPRLPTAAQLKLREADAAARAEASGEAPASRDEAPTPPAAPAPRARVANAHAEILDKLPIAVLVNRGETALYANRTLLDLLDYADLDDLSSAGGIDRVIRSAAVGQDGPMILVNRLGALVSVDARMSGISWQGEPATLMAFRNSVPGGDLRLMSEEEAEQAELAAEFAAEEQEISSRVEALRLDLDNRQSRVSELTAMLDTATDGVVTVDGRGRILSLNRSAEALFGYDQREVTGELFTLLFAPESHSPALDYLDGLLGGGVASLMNDGREVTGRVRQGGRIPLFMTMGRIAEGEDSKFCAVLRDITAWKKTEGELVEARKAAEKASAQKSDVLAKISHEIRTPLNAIIGFAEVMSEERFGPIDNERYKEYLRDIHQSGGYVISLVNDLLDLAKIEAGKLDLDFVSVNLNEIALSAVNLLQPEAQRGRVVLRSGLAPKLPPVVADQRSIRQIVINLLSNAVKFTDAGGQVIVSTALGDQGEAILRVRDTGIGMDDRELALALEPFRQVPTTRRAGGTGLGLPLTKALVEANRAAMTITSVKKEGTLVEITFPPQRVLAG